jgi:hypothetical protein
MVRELLWPILTVTRMESSTVVLFPTWILTYTGSAPTSTFFGQSQENWFLHQPNSTTRLTTTAFGGGFQMNQTTPSYQEWWKNELDNDSKNYGTNANWLFEDDMSAGLPFYNLSASSSQEIQTTAQLQAAHAEMSAAVTRSGGQANSTSLAGDSAAILTN